MLSRGYEGRGAGWVTGGNKGITAFVTIVRSVVSVVFVHLEDVLQVHLQSAGHTRPATETDTD
ncbi:hypothetical protein E2C01_023669 [Portunus trituberculatus]|uniref:Uncharacterized protein n=1 Tax=Portunus trituberculatus TaxID=210409 RepID=A0A5B7EAN1_PORTR|nr:hypothetical protein [Portunus trituberculatus]